MDGLYQESKGTLQLLYDSLGQNGKVNFWLLVIQILCELRNALRIRFCLESKAFAF